MARTVSDVAREILLSFPESEEFLSHGTPTFRVRGGKSFAVYTVNHHGDGRIALWLCMPEGAQDLYVGGEPERFFVPPYLGPKGWLGVRLDRDLPWKRVAELAREAYLKVAPARIGAKLGKPVAVKPPTEKPTLEDMDPMRAPALQRVLDRFRKLVASWPEVSEGEQFGSPTWRVGKKGFAGAWLIDARLHLAFRVGLEQQSLLVADKRFRVPAYMGHNGWIALDVSRRFDADEIRGLAMDSYRHFALKRMLAKLPAS